MIRIVAQEKKHFNEDGDPKMKRITDQNQIKGLTLEGLTVQAGPADSLLIDIGTTTIALALMNSKEASLVATTSFANPQRSFGDDVISRVQAQLEGQGEELTRLLRTGLLDQTKALCRQHQIPPSSLQHTYIAGNTCMIHSLLGYDMTPLSASPFRLKEENPEAFDWRDEDFHTRVVILPWLSTFIGGDITAGLLACGLEQYQNALFLDLGTNGEMVLKKGDSYYMCSTAAGPAFEGNGLTCGLPAIPGAISKVKLRPLGAQTETIDNLLPLGLCGSGALSVSAELIRRGYVDSQGILNSKFPEEGILLAKSAKKGQPLYFQAQDLRQIQLAKAAIAAGIDTMAEVAKLDLKDLDQALIGGGFGFFLDPKDSQTLGLLSQIPASKVKALGNTCLLGLFYLACGKANLKTLPNFHFVPLGHHKVFKSRFIQQMKFPDQDNSTT